MFDPLVRLWRRMVATTHKGDGSHETAMVYKSFFVAGVGFMEMLVTSGTPSECERHIAKMALTKPGTTYHIVR